MKPFIVLLALICFLIVSVSVSVSVSISGAVRLPMTPVHELAALARQQRTDAGRHVAQGDHESAARCFSRAADYYVGHAVMLDSLHEHPRAVKSYYNAAAMHASSAQQEKLIVTASLVALIRAGQYEKVFFASLVSEYADAKRTEQELVMEREAACSCSATGPSEKVLLKRQVEAMHYQRDTLCAETAARFSSSAVRAYQDANDVGRAHIMKKAEACQYAVSAMGQMAQSRP